MTGIVFALSYVGSKQKKTHLLIPNFLLMMGIVENCSLFTQIILTFKQGTWQFGIVIIFAWIFLIFANPAFAYLFKKRVADVDIQYKKWVAKKEN